MAETQVGTETEGVDASVAAVIEEAIAPAAREGPAAQPEPLIVAPPPPATPAREYTASIFPAQSGPMDRELAEQVLKLQTLMGMEVLILVQGDIDPNESFSMMGEEVREGFFELRNSLKRNTPVALMIHTNGGQAKVAYEIARLLRDHCGKFTAIIPRYAKSAGTLLALGGNPIVLGEHAELGPLDVQVWDPEREEYTSALNEVQSLERLQAFSLSTIETTVLLLKSRSGKKLATLMPMVHKYVAELTRPLFEKIDTVHYTWMARLLKIAEEYAIRLLQPLYKDGDAKAIARKLVHNYPEHDFMIDAREAGEIGLNVVPPTPEQAVILDAIIPRLDKCMAIGRIQEMGP